MTEIIPNHVGLIMDGNRRWAKGKNLPIKDGHLAGYNNLKKLIKHIYKKGTKYISIYAFSTENFNRDEKEVNNLMQLMKTSMKAYYKEAEAGNLKILFSGKEEPLEKSLIKEMRIMEEKTTNNKKGILNICLNYGGRSELVDLVKKAKETNIEITEETMRKLMYHDLPDIDLLIRTSGEQRISNFMPYHIAYAELYFSPVLFPDFNEWEYDKVIQEYNKRDRRFGGN